jgi:hypothetical protein
MQRYQVTLTGRSPMLMHNRNLDWETIVKQWSKDPAHKSVSVAGDDRSPAWAWLGKLHHNEEVICLPADMVSSCMMYGGAMVPLPKGKRTTTCKSLSQSGCFLEGFFWPLLIQETQLHPIAVAPLFALQQEPDFAVHEAHVRADGFRLHVKPATVGMSSHIRVRPLFDRWRVEGVVCVTDEQLTQALLTTILDYAGTYKGVGDWRPGCKTPGPWGMFTATVAPASAT